MENVYVVLDADENQIYLGAKQSSIDNGSMEQKKAISQDESFLVIMICFGSIFLLLLLMFCYYKRTRLSASSFSQQSDSINNWAHSTKLKVHVPKKLRAP